MRFLSIAFIIVVIGFGPSTAAGQSAETVPWTAFTGRDNEFIVYIPQGHMNGGMADVQLGPRENAPKIKATNRIARLINGTLLMLTYFEGEVGRVKEELLKRDRLELDGEKQAGGFTISNYRPIVQKMTRRVQFLTRSKRMYVVQAIYPTGDDRIANGYYASVRLFDGGKATAPNAPEGAQKTYLPKLVEKEPIRESDDKVFEGAPDREVVVVGRPFAKIASHPSRGRYNYALTVDVVYGASGKITDVKAVDGLRLYENEVTDAIKRTVFIPAQKDGKLVSVRRRIVSTGGSL